MKEHKIKKYFTLLLFTIFAVSILACNKDKNANNPGNNSGDFEGNVIIVGAGAAGLAAAKKLGEEGVSYQILEATEKWGGRIQKNVDFADFPIDLGAEWIHEDKSILNIKKIVLLPNRIKE